MSTLTIRHLPETHPPRFQALNLDGNATTPVEVRPAAGYPVEGRPDSDLMAELRWYLEDFLEYPFHPETEHAERVLAALRNWATDAFDVLFGCVGDGSGDGGDGATLFGHATADGPEKLRLRIQSDDPRVLSWPWEVLRAPRADHLVQVERCLEDLDAPPVPTAELPRDRVNILLVTARPYEGDVGFRSISRPVIDLMEKEELPVDVHILRPPTFERLQEHLAERPRHYHILHFDGHGAYRPSGVPGSSAAAARQAVKAARPVLELDGEPPPTAFVGRDGAILQLERALRARPPAILVHGLGGVGKTTLARGFVEWLARTDGLGAGCFWLTFQEVRSAEYVFNRLGEKLFGTQFAVLDADHKIAVLAQVFKDNRFLVVWDNFEVVAGVVGTSAHPTLSEEDRAQLATFLAALHGGQTKVLITSRSEEDWLGPLRRIVPLGGLRGEERWVYCEEILGELGLDVDRQDPELKELMDLLGGHPLSMRVLLPELAKRRAGELIAALHSNLASLDLDVGDAGARLYATVGFAEEALDPRLRPLLVPLAFHNRFVQRNILQLMAQQMEPSPSRVDIAALLQALAGAGLLRELAPAIFEMHPVLTGFLRSTFLKRADAGLRDRCARAFVEVFAGLADQLAPRQLHEQRGFIHLHGANLLSAVEEAERLNIATAQMALYQAMGVFAENQHGFTEAGASYKKLAEAARKGGDAKFEAGAYHQLGIIAQERRDFDAAEKWYQKALQIKEKLGNEHGAASTYGQLGIIAGHQERFEESGRWLLKCILTFIKAKDVVGAQRNASNFMISFKQASPQEQAMLRSLWEDAGLPWPEDSPGA